MKDGHCPAMNDQNPLGAIAGFIASERGDAPLNEIVAFAARYFAVDYVHIAMLTPDLDSVRIVAGYLDGKLMEPGYVYALAGTPCEHVLKNEHTCYAEHVQEHYPADRDLAALHAEGYIGEPVCGSDGRAVGLIALVQRHPLQSSATLVAAMKILAGYIGSTVINAAIRDNLREERDYVRNILETVDTMIVLLDLEGRIGMINRKGCEILGYALDELPGKDWFTTCLPQDQDPDAIREVYRKIIRGEVKQVEYYENDIITSGGITRTIAWHNSIVRNSDGTIVGGLSSGMDITEMRSIQREVETGSKRLECILSTTLDAFWAVDLEGHIVDVNDAACKMLGYSRDEMLTRSIRDIDVRHSDMDIAASMMTLKKQGSVLFETVHRAADGRRIDVEVSVTLIPKQSLYVSFIRDISERKRSENELANQKGFLRTLINTIPDLVWLKDPDGVYLACNSRFERLYGVEEQRLLGKTDYDFVDRELADFFRRNDRLSIDYGGPRRNEEWVTFAVDGHRELLETTKTPMFDSDGRLIGVLGIGHDITVQRADEEKFRQSEQSYRTLFDSLREAVYVQDTDGVFVAVNKGAAKMYGLPKEWFIGKSPADVSAPGLNDLDAIASHVNRALAGEPQSFEFWGLRSDGSVFPKEVHLTRGTWFGEEVVFAVSLDITERKRHERELERIAHYDALTGLPNRLLLADRLHQAMVQAERRGGLLAIVYLDLDGFKEVNDTYGHETGDSLLIQVSRRMKTALREGDTLARLGGDEFVAVLNDLPDRGGSIPVLERLLESIAESTRFDGIELKVSASIGVTFFPQAHERVDADQLIRQGDQAMYLAKQGGKNRYYVFDTEHDRTLRGRHENIQNIQNALERGEFELYYQPKVNLRTGEVVGAEALIRWNHPEQGVLPPAAFLPVIDNHPLSVSMGEWVLDATFRQIVRWKSAQLRIPVSVNIDGFHMQHKGFVDFLRALFEKYDRVRPEDIELEVLETSALEDIAQVSGIIRECGDMGVRFALDDFGTGYSSLTYLKRLPAKVLKIDKSFVMDMHDDPDDMAILSGVLGLANVFGRKVIAEGVETVEHGRILLLMGCEHAQGFAIARPMPAADFERWAAEWRPDESWNGVKPLDQGGQAMLYAIVEHRAWVKHIKNYILTGQGRQTFADVDHCQFGQWLEKYHRLSAQVDGRFDTLQDVHHSIHDIADRLLNRHDGAGMNVVLQGIEEFEKVSERLIDLAMAIVDDSSKNA